MLCLKHWYLHPLEASCLGYHHKKLQNLPTGITMQCARESEVQFTCRHQPTIWDHVLNSDRRRSFDTLDKVAPPGVSPNLASIFPPFLICL